MDEMDAVPVVRGADDHRVDVLALEDVAVVAIDGRPGDLLGRPFQPLFVDVANGHALRLAAVPQGSQFAVQAASPSPHADVTDDHPVVGPFSSRRRQGLGGDDLRGAEGRPRRAGRLQEGAAGHSLVVLCHLACLSVCSKQAVNQSQSGQAGTIDIV